MPYRTVRAEIEKMLSDNLIGKEGEKRYRFYLERAGIGLSLSLEMKFDGNYFSYPIDI